MIIHGQHPTFNTYSSSYVPKTFLKTSLPKTMNRMAMKKIYPNVLTKTDGHINPATINISPKSPAMSS
jgi:hypothetical protein